MWHFGIWHFGNDIILFFSNLFHRIPLYPANNQTSARYPLTPGVLAPGQIPCVRELKGSKMEATVLHCRVAHKLEPFNVTPGLSQNNWIENRKC